MTRRGLLTRVLLMATMLVAANPAAPARAGARLADVRGHQIVLQTRTQLVCEQRQVGRTLERMHPRMQRAA